MKEVTDCGIVGSVLAAILIEFDSLHAGKVISCFHSHSPSQGNGKPTSNIPGNYVSPFRICAKI